MEPCSVESESKGYTYQRRKSEYTTLIKIGIILLMNFGIMMYLNFAIDTFIEMGWGWKRTAYDMVVRNGRPVTALMFCIAGLFNISYETFYYIQYWLGMLFLETSIYIINNTLKEYIKNENQRILISYISVANIFMLEYFAFIEISGFMVAILLNCIAVSKFEHYFRTDKKCKKDIIISTILIIIAIFTYQGTLALFVMLSTPFALRCSNNLKEKLANILWIFVPYIISGITCLITVKYILGSSRFADINMGSMVYLAILKIQYSILSAVKSLITTFDILPCGVYLVIVSVVIICSISMCNHYNEKEKYNNILNILIEVTVSLVVSMLPTLLSAGFASLRVIYPIASIAAVLVMNAYINLLSKGECTESNSPTPIKLMHCMILLLIALQCVSFNKIYINRFQVNFADKETAKYIQEEISQYEKETGNTVTKIAIYCDSDSWYYNEDLSIDYGSQEISSRYYEIKSEVIRDSIYNSYWAAIPGINYYLGTNYERAEQSEYYTEYFSQFDWTRLSSKQLVFDGDTLHLCVY